MEQHDVVECEEGLDTRTLFNKIIRPKETLTITKVSISVLISKLIC